MCVIFCQLLNVSVSSHISHNGEDSEVSHNSPNAEDSEVIRNASGYKKSRKRHQILNSKRHRKRVNCCLLNCNALVVNLPRHLRQVHTDIPEFEVRKLLKDIKKKPKRQYKVLSCSVGKCCWKGTRPEKHLVSKAHNYEKAYASKIAKQIKMQDSLKGANIQKLGKDIFTADSLADSFLDWYQSIEGGNYIPDFIDEHKKVEKSHDNKRCKMKIQRLLKATLGDGVFHISALECLDTIGRSTKTGEKSVIEQLKEHRSWSTIKNYLNAFSHFVDFMESSKPPLLDKNRIASIRMALEELQRRKISDRSRVVDFNHIRLYQSMNIAQTLSKSLLVDDADAEAVAERVHRVSRHILLQMALPNAKRAGIFTDMKCNEVKSALREEGGFVITVAEVKTFRIAGAAGVFCSESEYELLENYVSKWRPHLNPQSYQVFCRRSGERARVGEIGDFFRDAWSDFGSMVAKDVGDITFTLIRKTIVSKSRSDGVDKSVKEDMAVHMNHSVQTADRHYDVSTGARLTAKFRKIFNRFHDPIDSKDSDDDDDDLAPSERLKLCSGLPLPQGDKSSKHCIEKIIAGNSSMTAAVRKSTFGKPDVFTDEDKLRLYRCCTDLIERGRKNSSCSGVTKAEIFSKIKLAGPNFADLLKNYTISQICNRIRCEIRKKTF